jgi:hypothetical protein
VDQQTSLPTVTQAAYQEKLCPKAATASTPHAHKLTSTAMQPTSRCREHLHKNLAAPKPLYGGFTNNAG